MTAQIYLKQLDQHYQAGIATEHTCSAALQALLESALPGVAVTNEPKQIACGAPDLVLTRNAIPLGYIEAKDLGKDLNDPAHKEQLRRYTESLGNLIFTNYLEFRLIRDGKPVQTVAIGEIVNGKIKSKTKNFAGFTALLDAFIGYQGQTIQTANDLAKHMARKARLLAETITKVLRQDEGAIDQSRQLSEINSARQGQLAAFQKHLIHDITPAAFADTGKTTITLPEIKVGFLVVWWGIICLVLSNHLFIMEKLYDYRNRH
ncbi:hypothetical protein [Candidatus Spongiihabitans sp.]|uniref:hypothetical protein n=1 Tax=Candidatus Spongiihabitans sp. TaxID=3101308 RepID=UPI003C7A06D2